MHNLLDNKKYKFCVQARTRKKLLKKTLFFAIKISPDLGKFPSFQEILKLLLFSPDLGKYPSLRAKSITKRPTQIAEVILEYSLILQPT